jgi:hypothetical protein
MATQSQTTIIRNRALELQVVRDGSILAVRVLSQDTHRMPRNGFRFQDPTTDFLIRSGACPAVYGPGSYLARGGGLFVRGKINSDDDRTAMAAFPAGDATKWVNNLTAAVAALDKHWVEEDAAQHAQAREIHEQRAQAEEIIPTAPADAYGAVGLYYLNNNEVTKIHVVRGGVIAAGFDEARGQPFVIVGRNSVMPTPVDVRFVLAEQGPAAEPPEGWEYKSSIAFFARDNQPSWDVIEVEPA